MASRLTLKTGIPGMNHIWNVTQRVGGLTSCPNLPTDVELVKVLLKKALEGAELKAVAARIPPAITVNSSFDAIVGYWIFRFQEHDGHPKIDGVASHARGVTYTPGEPWVIAFINAKAFKADPKFWNDLPHNTSLSQQLRNELSK